MENDPEGIPSSAYAEELSRFIELMPDAVIGSDIDGNIVFANTMASELFGYSLEELLELQISSLVPDRERDRHESERRTSFETKPIRPMHAGLALHGRRSTGELFPADISLSWLRRADGDIAVTAVRDISDHQSAVTERAKIEAELARDRAKRLESVGKLASDVATGFNDQLGVILNHARFLRDALSGQPELAEDARRIEQAARRGAELTKKLLVFGQRGLRFPKIDDVNRLVAELEDEINSRLGDEVELQLSLADDVWAASVDAPRFRECILYMVDNAAEAIEGAGVVRVATANVELVESPDDPDQDLPRSPGRYVVITVSDSGEGMEREVRERIFEPFFSTKETGTHLGMGLATVYGSVKQAGGNVTVLSEPDVGTSVVTYLPAVEWPKSGGESEGTTLSVLVVDQDESQRGLVERILESHGHRVTSCETTEAAVAALSDEDKAFDVLITELETTEFPGSTLAQDALRLRPSLTILHMTSYDGTIREEQQAGARGLNLVEKPFAADTLIETLASAVERKQSN